MHYGLVMSPKSATTELPVDKDMRDALHNLHERKVDVVHPFLLRVLEDFRLGTLQLNALKEIVETCDSHIFRRIICGLPTNSHNKTFAGLAKLDTTGSYIEAFRKAIYGMVSYKRMSGDSDFIKELKVKDLYNVRGSGGAALRCECQSDLQVAARSPVRAGPRLGPAPRQRRRAFCP